MSPQTLDSKFDAAIDRQATSRGSTLMTYRPERFLAASHHPVSC